MKNNSHKILEKIKNKGILKKLILSDTKKKSEVKEIKILKDKWIFKNDFKITVLVKIDKLPYDIIMELHDNLDYYYKNLFALKNFFNFKNDKISMAKLYGYNNELRIIYREQLGGVTMIHKLNRINSTRVKEYVKCLSSWLVYLHNYMEYPSKKFLLIDLNTKVEQEIFKKVKEFIKPNIKTYENRILNNLNYLLNNFDSMYKKFSRCLIHGDFQPANFYLDKEKIYISDFDTLQVGNPARDLGRLMFQFKNFYHRKVNLEKIILQEYFKLRKLDINTKNKITKDINFYQAEMIAYVILDKIWGEKIPNKQEINQLITVQGNLLQKFKQ